MNIQPIISYSPIQQNSSPNFKRRLEGEYVKALIDYGIKKPRGMSNVINGIRRILNDGVKGIVKIDFSKYKLENFLFPGTYRITVDGVNKGTNYHFIGGGIGLQGEFALQEVYKDEFGNLIPHKDPKEYESRKISELKKKIRDCWDAIFDEYDALDTNHKKILKIKKNMKSLEKKLDKTIQEEFIKLKAELFPIG